MVVISEGCHMLLLVILIWSKWKRMLQYHLNPVGTRYWGDIGFVLDLHRDIDRLRIETEVTSLYDIFFQNHNDVLAITQRNVKLHVIVILIFNVVLISDKDENAINNSKHFVLFHFRSSRAEVICKKGVYRNFAKFTRKYLCQSLFFSKVAGLKPAILLY